MIQPSFSFSKGAKLFEKNLLSYFGVFLLQKLYLKLKEYLIVNLPFCYEFLPFKTLRVTKVVLVISVLNLRYFQIEFGV